MITVFGSINLDLIGNVSRIPQPGETVPGTQFATAPGGKGANQALAARRAGAHVRLVGAAGSNAMGEEALVLLRDVGVDLSEVARPDLPQGVAMIFVDPRGENVIAILSGANAAVTAAEAERTLTALAPGDVLLVQQEIAQEATLRALALAKERGATSVLNTAPFLPSTPEAAAAANIVVANETEFALLFGAMPDPELLQSLARDRQQTLIVTLGSDGALAATPERAISAPALAITPVDTVGAGDTFTGYLAAGIAAGIELEHAIRRAAIAGSLACLKPGAQPAIPMAGEVDAALGERSGVSPG